MMFSRAGVASDYILKVQLLKRRVKNERKRKEKEKKERKEEEFVKERRRRAERLLCTVKVVDVEFVCDEYRHKRIGFDFLIF